jgi:SAM-dependent methyltransferase
MDVEMSMEHYYARRAAEYERIYAKPERQEDLGRLKIFLERAFAGTRVFEVACGTGYWTEVVARSAASVVAIDVNEEVLAMARGKGMDSAKVRFCRGDAYALPTVGERFGGGLGASWWSHVPRRRMWEFLEGFHWMLAKGARVVFMDNVYVEGSSTPVSRVDEFGDTYQMRKLDDGSRHEVLKNFPTEAELRAAVKGWGKNIEVQWLKYYWILEYVVK